ncbi:MAG: hypothetical protein GY763_02445 [Gammaproteobacteria bacterium]|nr:hypothetical protein [Gammaproteobacteria bacterium]
MSIKINDKPNRLYPDWVPIAENEPSGDDFEKANRPEYGYCILSKSHFGPGDVLARIYGGIIKDDPELHTVQKRPGVHIYDEWFTGLVLHSCDPNTYFNPDEETFVAIKAINPKDIVTCDYQLTEDNLVRAFECKCGATNCRGLMLEQLRQLDH